MKKIVAALASTLLVTSVFAQTAATHADKAQVNGNNTKAEAQADANKDVTKTAQATTSDKTSDARGEAAKAQAKADKKKHAAQSKADKKKQDAAKDANVAQAKADKEKSRLKATRTRRLPMRRSTRRRSREACVIASRTASERSVCCVGRAFGLAFFLRRRHAKINRRARFLPRRSHAPRSRDAR